MIKIHITFMTSLKHTERCFHILIVTDKIIYKSTFFTKPAKVTITDG